MAGCSDASAGLLRFRRPDYHGDPAVALADAVRDTVEREIGIRPEGPIRLLTNLRSLGLCFNPVSFYYCFDRGRAAAAGGARGGHKHTVGRAAGVRNLRRSRAVPEADARLAVHADGTDLHPAHRRPGRSCCGHHREPPRGQARVRRLTTDAAGRADAGDGAPCRSSLSAHDSAHPGADLRARAGTPRGRGACVLASTRAKTRETDAHKGDPEAGTRRASALGR